MEKLFVARRFDRDPKLKIKFYAYSETLTSQSYEISGKVACTMFCKKETTLNRLLKEGWKDCTKEYRDQLAKKEEDLVSSKKETKKVKRGRPKSTKRK